MKPYLADDELLDSLAAGKRGFAVYLLVPAQSNNPSARHAVESNGGRPLASGAQIWGCSAIMHVEAVVAAVTIAGTINRDTWALCRNHEMALRLNRRAVAGQVELERSAGPHYARLPPGGDRPGSGFASATRWRPESPPSFAVRYHALYR